MITLQWKPFWVNIKRMDLYLKTNIANYDGMISNTESLIVTFKAEASQSDLQLLSSYWNSLTDVSEITLSQSETFNLVESQIDAAMTFGLKLIKKFATENVIMGITQDGKTSSVRKAMTEVISALSTGSLYDAIHEARTIPLDQYDDKYITATRLLSFINSIEAYLGRPKSTSL